MLSFAVAICEQEKESESRKRRSASEGRNCTTESGAPAAGGYTYNKKEVSTKEHGTTDTKNISGRQEKNRGSTACTLGKGQSSEEGVNLG